MTKFPGFLVIATALFSQTACSRPPQAHAATGKPNMLFIVAGDMNRYSVLKNYPVLQTPVIAKLVGRPEE